MKTALLPSSPCISPQLFRSKEDKALRNETASRCPLPFKPPPVKFQAPCPSHYCPFRVLQRVPQTRSCDQHSAPPAEGRSLREITVVIPTSSHFSPGLSLALLHSPGSSYLDSNRTGGTRRGQGTTCVSDETRRGLCEGTGGFLLVVVSCFHVHCFVSVWL